MVSKSPSEKTASHALQFLTLTHLQQLQNSAKDIGSNNPIPFDAPYVSTSKTTPQVTVQHEWKTLERFDKADESKKDKKKDKTEPKTPALKAIVTVDETAAYTVIYLRDLIVHVGEGFNVLKDVARQCEPAIENTVLNLQTITYSLYAEAMMNRTGVAQANLNLDHTPFSSIMKGIALEAAVQAFTTGNPVKIDMAFVFNFLLRRMRLEEFSVYDDMRGAVESVIADREKARKEAAMVAKANRDKAAKESKAAKEAEAGTSSQTGAAVGGADGGADGAAVGDADGDANGDANGDADGGANEDADGDANEDADGDANEGADGDANEDAEPPQPVPPVRVVPPPTRPAARQPARAAPSVPVRPKAGGSAK